MVDHINNGEQGLSVREKLNTVIDRTNDLMGIEDQVEANKNLSQQNKDKIDSLSEEVKDLDVTVLDNKIDKEIQDRIDGDANLQGQIDNLSTSDNDFQDQIDDLVVVDEGLQDQIDAIVAELGDGASYFAGNREGCCRKGCYGGEGRSGRSGGAREHPVLKSYALTIKLNHQNDDITT